MSECSIHWKCNRELFIWIFDIEVPHSLKCWVITREKVALERFIYREQKIFLRDISAAWKFHFKIRQRNWKVPITQAVNVLRLNFLLHIKIDLSYVSQSFSLATIWYIISVLVSWELSVLWVLNDWMLTGRQSAAITTTRTTLNKITTWIFLAYWVTQDTLIAWIRPITITSYSLGFDAYFIPVLIIILFELIIKNYIDCSFGTITRKKRINFVHWRVTWIFT